MLRYAKPLIDALKECEQVFLTAAEYHKEKHRVENHQQAQWNLEMAMKCRSAYAQHRMDCEETTRRLQQAETILGVLTSGHATSGAIKAARDFLKTTSCKHATQVRVQYPDHPATDLCLDCGQLSLVLPDAAE